MRTTCVIALVASLMIFTGCTAVNGPNCGGQWGGFCDEGDCGGCGTNGFARGGFALPSLGFNRLGVKNGGGCDSGGCSASANFSDYNYDCGPMCGAFLNEGQTAAGCGCDSCEMGQSYVGGQWSQWMGNCGGGINWPRPFAGGFGGLTSAIGCGSDGGVQAGGGLMATCRGLGSMVGCFGCNDCGNGSAVGSNHSNCSNSMAGSCGPDGCGATPTPRFAGRVRGMFFRPNGSPHPYGGEQPHTGAPADCNGYAGSAAPAYAYPYYTTRGPRDFLMANPPSIGR